MSSEIRDIRTQAGLSQTDLSCLSGVTQTTISLIERGKIDPLTSTIKRLKCAINDYNLAHPLGVCAVSVAVQEVAEGVGFLSGGGQ